MWNSITFVTTGLTLVAFLTAAGAFVYSASIRRKERLIKVAPESKRAPLVRDALEFFHVKTENLTKDQQFQIVLEQIRGRAQRFQLGAVSILVLAVILAVISVYAILYAGETNPEQGSKATFEQIVALEIDLKKLDSDLTALNVVINRKKAANANAMNIFRRLVEERDQAQIEGRIQDADRIQRQIWQIQQTIVDEVITFEEHSKQQNLEFEITRKRELLNQMKLSQ